VWPSLSTAWSEIKHRKGARERVTQLVVVLASLPPDLDPQTVRAITDIAEEIHSREPSVSRSLLKELQPDSPPACQWMKASLLELQSNPEEAAAVLDSFTHLHSAESEALRLQALCRNLIASQQWPEAIVALKESTQRTNSVRLQLANEKLLDSIRKAGQTGAKRQSKLAVLGNATFDFLAPILRVCAFASGIDLEIYRGSYGQQQQEILGPSSALEAFRPSIVLLAMDWRSLALPEAVQGPDAWVEANLEALQNLWRHCRERFHAQVVQHNFEVPVASAYGRLSMVTQGGRARLIQRLNLELWRAASTASGVQILDVDQIASAYGKSRWDNRSLWHAAKQYPAAEALPVLARHQVALLRALLGLNSKCLVLDLDGTLWGGVIGEDGIAGIRLGGSPEGDAYREFQSYLKSLRERGVILTACSKNNEADAKLVFTSHPETVLSLNDFAVFLADWNPKDENLRRIAKSLNIGLDSMVFVDDSPVERAWIRRQLPEVEVPELPVDPADYVRSLDQHLYFEGLEVTEEDRQRADYYRANLEREQLQEAGGNLEDFLAGLQMRVELRPFDEANLPRISQLINKTNQFNLTTQRLSVNQVRELIGDANHYTQFIRVRDRFGDDGITGILIASRDGEGLRVDNWLMSCRVLGRKLEEAMLDSVRKYALRAGYEAIVGLYRPTVKNHQVADLYERLGFDLIETAGSGGRKYRLPLFRAPECPSWFVVEDHTQVVAPLTEEIARQTPSQ
jgi:FkbH-like protein